MFFFNPKQTFVHQPVVWIVRGFWIRHFEVGDAQSRGAFYQFFQILFIFTLPKENLAKMELTKEQIDIINSTGNIKINAVAGSGKTTTIIEFAKAKPKNARILYLAFNKSVKLEAQKKFLEIGLNNVRVETAHSIAFRYIVARSGYRLKQEYKTYEIAELLGLETRGEQHGEYIVANHINKFISYFCNSNKQKVQDLSYLDVVSDAQARSFVTKHYKYIEKQTRLLLAKMDSGDIDITHDFYLKKFQLSNPVLPYDYILFDEGQDASQAMLQVFTNQKAVKVIVGDTHQQIYGWRYAINSLEKVDFKSFFLTTSFRFSQDIANLAKEILKWKEHLGDYKPIPITGLGTTKNIKTKAVLARTNLGLLLKAIEYVQEKKNIKGLYFEGNINSYTYADDGASLYDVLNLYNGKRQMIKDKLIKQMKDLSALEDYIEKTEDVQLGMMVEIVNEYGNKIPGLIKNLKEKHVDNDEKEKAEIIFSTVHRSKGMEYDSVQLVNDFISEEKIEKLMKDPKDGKMNLSKINEEINLLYVAVTRTKKNLVIPEALLPKDFPDSPFIHVLKEVSIEEVMDAKIDSMPKRSYKTVTNTLKEKVYEVEEVRKKYKEAYQPWTEELDDKLTEMYCEGVHVKDMAKYFGRTRGAIVSRIKKLELELKYG
jgi:F-box protein, helicase, 18